MNCKCGNYGLYAIKDRVTGQVDEVICQKCMANKREYELTHLVELQEGEWQK